MASSVSIQRKEFPSISAVLWKTTLPCEVMSSLSLEMFQIRPNVNVSEKFTHKNEKTWLLLISLSLMVFTKLRFSDILFFGNSYIISLDLFPFRSETPFQHRFTISASPPFPMESGGLLIAICKFHSINLISMGAGWRPTALRFRDRHGEVAGTQDESHGDLGLGEFARLSKGGDKPGSSWVPGTVLGVQWPPWTAHFPRGEIHVYRESL